MVSSGSPSRSAFAGFVNAAADATDLEQLQQAAAEAHAPTAVPASAAGSTDPREPRQDFDISTPAGQQVRQSPAEFQEVLRQLAGLTALLERMRQEGEAVQLKVTNLEKLVVPPGSQVLLQQGPAHRLE